MQLDQILNYGQSNTKSAPGTGRGALRLIEELKNLRQFLRRHADSGIFDPDDNIVVQMCRRKPDMPSVLTVCRGIVQKVNDDLLQTGWVSIDPPRQTASSAGLYLAPCSGWMTSEIECAPGPRCWISWKRS
jgi:hypothetical protein